MTALLIWGFFVLAIDACTNLIQHRAIHECSKGASSQATENRSDVIECLKNLGLDESQIAESLSETKFDSKHNGVEDEPESERSRASHSHDP